MNDAEFVETEVANGSRTTGTTVLFGSVIVMFLFQDSVLFLILLTFNKGVEVCLCSLRSRSMASG